MDVDVGELLCTVAFEQLSGTGEVLKRTLQKNTTLNLGRNEFKELIMKLTLGKRQLKFLLRDIVIHKKFAREGKSTIKMPSEKTQLMLSNCPPDRLLMFLKTMSTKLECLKQTAGVSDRKRLTSDLPRVFQEISPLNMKDLETAHNIRAKAEESRTDLFTPKGKGKRKRAGEDEKENRPPKSSVLGRRQPFPPQSAVTSRPTLNPVVLSKEQIRVLEAVRSRKNIFFTGSAGTGKSFLLKRIIGALPPQYTFATASTGVAACHIGGTTLHAFAGIGSGRAALPQCVELASRPVIAQQWKKCRHLIIDEVSMVDGQMFDKLEMVARVIRHNDEPFGGIQLILCGDFLQLPPVTKKGEKRIFAFQSKSWQKCMHTNLELTEVRRQSDKKFIDILQDIRLGRCCSEVADVLVETGRHHIDSDGIQATRLCTHKEDVDQINTIHLQKLQAASRVFQASDSDSGLSSTFDNQFPVRSKLELKEGAQVMLTKNLDVSRGLVNGARGVVVGFETGQHGHPKVKFLCGEEIALQPERWVLKAPGGALLSRRQLPLKLAWAISIHKSQGMSLDCVELSLSKVFESGQAYVALSRARSLQGLRVLDFTKNCVRADPDVLKFYRRMRVDQRLEQRMMNDFLPLGGGERSGGIKTL